MQAVTGHDLPAAPIGKSGWPWTVEIAEVSPTLPGGAPWPRITVVTPSFNQAQFLEETIRSVLLQGYPNLEYIIIDGGSTDESIEIIRKYEPWLAYWVSEPDGGQADAINKGFARATGDVLGWLNSDDTYETNALRVVAGHFMSRPACGLLYGTGWRVDDGGERIGPCHWVGPYDRKAQLNHNQILQPAAFWRRDLWEEVGPLDSRYNWGLDWEWFIRATSVVTPEFVRVDLANWRITSDIKTLSHDPRHFAELAAICRRHGGVCQPTYFMYQLSRTIRWITHTFGLSLPARAIRYPVILLRHWLDCRYYGRYIPTELLDSE